MLSHIFDLSAKIVHSFFISFLFRSMALAIENKGSNNIIFAKRLKNSHFYKFLFVKILFVVSMNYGVTPELFSVKCY